MRNGQIREERAGRSGQGDETDLRRSSMSIFAARCSANPVSTRIPSSTAENSPEGIIYKERGIDITRNDTVSIRLSL